VADRGVEFLVDPGGGFGGESGAAGGVGEVGGLPHWEPAVLAGVPQAGVAADEVHGLADPAAGGFDGAVEFGGQFGGQVFGDQRGAIGSGGDEAFLAGQGRPDRVEHRVRLAQLGDQLDLADLGGMFGGDHLAQLVDQGAGAGFDLAAALLVSHDRHATTRL